MPWRAASGRTLCSDALVVIYDVGRLCRIDVYMVPYMLFSTHNKNLTIETTT
jgi:hypothetical protein